jgi:hypothetical protein
MLVTPLKSHTVVDKVAVIGRRALGSPDLYDFSKVSPMRVLARPLLRLQRWVAELPGVRRLGRGILVRAHRAA